MLEALLRDRPVLKCPQNRNIDALLPWIFVKIHQLNNFMYFSSKSWKVTCLISTLYIKSHIIKTSKTRLASKAGGNTLTLILYMFKGLVQLFLLSHIILRWISTEIEMTFNVAALLRKEKTQMNWKGQCVLKGKKSLLVLLQSKWKLAHPCHMTIPVTTFFSGL